MSERTSCLEGYLYPCSGVECRGIIIYPKRITIEDFSRAIQRYREFELEFSGDDIAVQQDLEMLQKNLENNELYCSFIVPCYKSKDHGLGSDNVELITYLHKFKGKKVRITVEVLEE